MPSLQKIFSLAGVAFLMLGTTYADTCGPNNQNRKLGSTCKNQPANQIYECSCNDRAILYCDPNSQTWVIHEDCGNTGTYCNYYGPGPTNFNCISH